MNLMARAMEGPRAEATGEPMTETAVSISVLETGALMSL